MICETCFHAIANDGPCQMDVAQRVYLTDCSCHSFLDKNSVIKLPCKVGSTIYIHAYSRKHKKYEVTPIKNIQLSELAVLIEDDEPIFLDETEASDALGDRNNK